MKIITNFIQFVFNLNQSDRKCSIKKQLYTGQTRYEIDSLSSTNLRIIPKEKSVFFPIVDFENKTLLGPWQYLTGVFPGNFTRLVGSGGEGHVVAGTWNNIKAAFKWVNSIFD